jgi:hypothetical protein
MVAEVAAAAAAARWRCWQGAGVAAGGRLGLTKGGGGADGGVATKGAQAGQRHGCMGGGCGCDTGGVQEEMLLVDAAAVGLVTGGYACKGLLGVAVGGGCW